MKVILDKRDIENMIQNSFNGVKEVQLPEELSITLDVDPSSFTQFKPKSGTIVEPNKLATTNTTETPEEKKRKEKKKGLMASGGRDRNMMHF